MRTLIAAILAAALAACSGGRSDPAEKAPEGGPLAPEGWADASADFIDNAGATVGEAKVKTAPAGVLFRLDVRGLARGWHGIHFHQVADCSDGPAGFKKSGAHVDPGAREHGLLHEAGPEEGDLPNIYAGADGRVRAEIFRAGARLDGEGGLRDADGFAVIIHANEDDQATQPIGGAGDRVACAAVRPD
ncbi:MAG: superoxide dismutase family protein [Parvularculaceae bacterium]|jgi:Cu-Zn family superoxide dismutase|nr:superoxide dismutase family protein [Parvularculaceae bacterium]